MTLHLGRAWQHDELFVAEDSSAQRDRYPSVYLDTSIGSYLTARLRRDLTIARKQRLTRVWWQRYRDEHALFVSERVISEASKGDTSASEARLEALGGIRVLALDTRAQHLAASFIGGRLLPLKAAADAEHIAIAATNDVNILLTWNCKHLANPAIHREVVRVCEGRGLRCPEICTPEQLMRTYAHARSSS
jgi:hypothetical protein